MDGYIGKDNEQILAELNNYDKKRKSDSIKRRIKKVFICIIFAIGIGGIVGLVKTNIEMKNNIRSLKNDYKALNSQLETMTQKYEETMSDKNVSDIKNDEIIGEDGTASDKEEFYDNQIAKKMHIFDDWTEGDEVTVYKNTTIPWYLHLVNYENPIAEDFQVELKEKNNVYVFDARASDALEEMIADAQAEGLNPLICSTYRTLEKQSQLFNDYLNRLLKEGYDYDSAFKKVKHTNATPGNSEHHLGLAADIISKGYGILDEKQETTQEFKWLAANCTNYGFILRYPKAKYDITGIDYEPWHFRYVGKAAAKYITENKLTLEEYLDEYVEMLND